MIIDPQSLSPNAMYHWMIAVIVPRPIAFVSTLSRAGQRNVAPFSYFVPISSAPPLIGIAIQDRANDPKDTLRNIRETGEFVVNLVNEPLLSPMVRTSGEWPADVDEFDVSGIESAPSTIVKPPRVALSPASMECRTYREVELGSSAFVVGEILRLHVDDAMLVEGRVDPERLRAVGRLGGDAYSIVRGVVREARPKVQRGSAA
ncbi:MAG TPA: flavin reductase family protein [Candidatus Sulfotelmatobacter sp.]|nr:flavin reductase family protein [Candidatus Sulfotelmatobacter sp.]